MLLSLMYRRVGSQEAFFNHLRHLKENYPLVLPGDSLTKRKLSICLTFDGALFEFYHFLFPLLKDLNIRVLLGTSVKYIGEKASVDIGERLSVPYSLTMQDGFYDTKSPFCTWSELKEMVDSGLVEVASQSFAHCNLTFDFVNLEKEVVRSKEILEEKLRQPISSFIYPFGKTHLRLHEYVKEHYTYSFQIKSALNRNWGETKRSISRVVMKDSDNIASSLSLKRMCGYFFKFAFT